MKKLLLILLVLGVAAAIAYLVGTDAGRARRDDLMARARKTSDDADIDLTGESGIDEDLAATASVS